MLPKAGLPKLKREQWLRLAPALLFPLLVFLFASLTQSHLGDSDRYYHFALSRMLHEARAFSLPVLPQVDDLGWDQYFPDKEFLFHVLTRLGYSVGGDTGAANAVLLAAGGLGMVLYIFALGYLAPLPAFLCAFAAFATHPLFFRLLFLRPHVLALFFFTLLVAGLAKRKPALAGFASFGFALAYHAFYIPLLCAGFAGALALLEKKASKPQNRLILQAAALTIGGLVLGVLLNPYFPSQLVAGVQHARIPSLIRGELKEASFGLELYPVGAPGFLKFYLFPFAVLFFAARAWKPSYEARFLLALTAFWGLLAFQTVRAGEFLIPCAGLLFAVVLAGLKDQKKLAPRIAIGVAALQLAILLYVARTEARGVPGGERQEAVIESVKAIPAGPAKVLNCEWDMAPYLMYFRPDLSFVDLLDPTFLWFHDPIMYRAKERWLSGRLPDVYGFARLGVQAKFVLCGSAGANARMAADPAFRQLYPPPGVATTQEMRLFEVAAVTNSAFVREFWASVFPLPGAEQARLYDPGQRKETSEVKVAPGASSVEFANVGEALSCAHLSPKKEELERLQGAEFLGVGGGEALRVWRNGRLLFSSGRGYDHSRAIQALVPLEPKASGRDLFDILVCSRAAGPFRAVSLSLWKTADIYTQCRWKKGQGEAALPGAQAPFSGSGETCLGPIAPATLPEALRP